MLNRFLFPLILLLIVPAADALIIEDDTVCTDGEFIVAEALVVRSGASLVLEDCTLVMDVPEYQNQWVSKVPEGLLVTVEEGARLEVRVVDGPAGMRSMDPSYGYRLAVDGKLLLKGTPDVPVNVTGLEGYITEAVATGGIEVNGSATLEHVSFFSNTGPALRLTGGSAIVEHVTVRTGSGAFSIEGGDLILNDVDVNVGLVGLLGEDATVHVEDSSLRATKAALSVTDSTVTAVDSTLRGTTAVSLKDSDLDARGLLLRYVRAGIVHGHEDENATQGRLRVVDSRIEAFDDPSAIGITVTHTDLFLEDVVLRNHTRGAVATSHGSVQFHGVEFDGTGAFQAYLERPSSYDLRDNFVPGGVGIVYAAPVVVHVVNATGSVPNATLEIAGGVFQTGQDGSARLVLKVPFDGSGVLTQDALDLVVSSNGTVRTVMVPLDRNTFTVDLDAEPATNGSPGAPLTFVLVAVAAAFVLSRRV